MSTRSARVVLNRQDPSPGRIDIEETDILDPQSANEIGQVITSHNSRVLTLIQVFIHGYRSV